VAKNNRSTLIVLQKRPIILLEIMIAMAMIVLCILPLLAPRSAMLQEQRKFIDAMELDHAVSLFYVDILERLYRNQIAWNDIQDHTVFPIDSDLLQHTKSLQLPENLIGTYRFDIIKHKDQDDGPNAGWIIALVSLTFVFRKEGEEVSASTSGSSKKLVFQYEICLLRHTSEPPSSTEEAPEENPV
jgi:hypothetical protein